MRPLRRTTAVAVCLMLVLALVPAAASAAALPPPPVGGVQLNGVRFIGRSGWAVGGFFVSGQPYAVVERTTDGGVTWTRKTIAAADYLSSVSMVSTSTGWAVGATPDTVYKTTDGGANWTPTLLTSNIFLTGSQPLAVHFRDASRGWVAGGSGSAGGTIWSTANGGTTWARTFNGPMYQDPYGNPVGSQTDLSGADSCDARHGFVVGTEFSPNRRAHIYRTADGGTTWIAETVPAGLTTLRGVAAVDAAHAWAVGGTSSAGRVVGWNGSSWSLSSIPAAGPLRAVTFADATHGWAVGDGGAILFCDGTTWTKQTSGTTVTLLGAFFTDSSHGWAVGTGDTILSTVDGGLHWVAPAPDTAPPVTTISGVPASWTKASVTFGLAATDAGSGVSKTYYRLGGGASTAYSGPVTVSTEGITSIAYWSVDKAGNTEAVKTATASIDKSPPVTTSDATGTYDGAATIHLSATDPYSGVASTRWVLDGGAARTGALVSLNTTGAHTLAFASVDAAGNVENTTTVPFTITGTPKPIGLVFDSVEGAGRYDTAVQASKRAFPTAGSADTIVLATGANWPDALGGASLAGAWGGPLLLTKPDALSGQVLAEAARLDVTRVVILGSTRAVSAAVETALKAASVNGHKLTVTRVGGTSRYETASKIADATLGVLASKGRAYDHTAFFATGGNFPDALAASPIAAAKGWPILLVRPDTPTTFTEGAIASLDVTRGIMLGSPRAVSTVVETRLKALLPAAPSRLSGATRYDTGIAIARFGVAGGQHWDGVAIAVGTNFPDALAGGVMQGKLGSVVLLTPGTKLNAAVGAELTAHKGDIATVRYLGSTIALSQTVRDSVEAALK
jgi:putative cell wall-binding protein/photosystem II stability/assembly factor-like uncharacterized protein